MYLDRNSIASYRNYSKTLSNCLLNEFQLQCTKNIEKKFQNVSWAKLICILLKTFWDIFKLCLSWISVETYWIYSKTFSYCLLAEILLHGNRNVVRPFQKVSYLKFNCIVPKIFSDIFKFFLAETQLRPNWSILWRFPHVSWPKFDWILLKIFSNFFSLCVSRKPIALYWNYSESFWNCIKTEIHLHRTGLFLKPH